MMSRFDDIRDITVTIRCKYNGRSYDHSTIISMTGSQLMDLLRKRRVIVSSVGNIGEDFRHLSGILSLENGDLVVEVPPVILLLRVADALMIRAWSHPLDLADEVTRARIGELVIVPIRDQVGRLQNYQCTFRRSHIADMHRDPVVYEFDVLAVLETPVLQLLPDSVEH
jgi:hypothetical protein